ncbi:MAG: pyridoxal-phosphate dependent enzyme [Deltaproteobacteria bacterium]|nr:pyridoxal-phosphate dependent enzyme [Candidatus Zymogenaceae bacterium]
MSERPWIFSHFPALKGRIPFTSLGEYPSRVERLEKLSDYVGAEIWIKRDDAASCIYGGNKCRMMEFIIPDAKEKGRESLISWGALGSNQVVSSVIFGAHEGYTDITAVYGTQPYHAYVRRNFLISTSLGVDQHLAASDASQVLKLLWFYLKKLASGKKPYLIPLVGSKPISVLSYVDASLELKRQIDGKEAPAFDEIFVTVGTGGTAAGLILGSLIFPDIGRIVGVRVIEKSFVNRPIIAWEINRTRRFMKRLGADPAVGRVRSSDIEMLDYMGPAYAESTPECLQAIELLERLEGITLDVTYTGKTMAALLDRAHKDRNKRYLFWHTLNTVDISTITDALPDPCEAPECFHTHLGVDTSGGTT